MRSRVVFWLQLASLAATGCILWQQAMNSRWPLLSPSWVLVQAALFAAGAFMAGALITAVLYVILQQDPEYLIVEPLSTSTAAVWFAPAVILLTKRSPAGIVAALVLVINATRILYDQWRRSMKLAPVIVPQGLFASFQAETPSFWRLLAPALAASFCAQTAAAGVMLRHPFVAGVSIALCVATVTVFAQSSRAVEPRKPANLPRSMLGLLLTFVLAIGLTVGGMYSHYGGLGGGDADSGSAWIPGAGTSPTGQPASAPRQGVADTGFYGVILWPEVKPYATLIAPMPQGTALTPGVAQRPYGIPFAGEYWMYRWPFAHPPQNSLRERGSPAELSFSTTDRRALQMEAHHKLDQSIATDCCRAIQVEVRNADRYPRTIALELYLVGRPRQMWLGKAAVESQPKVSGDTVTPVLETLEFAMPVAPAIAEFDEFKLVFSRAQARMDKSAKLAIERFVLMPR
jgi:hypothetical protein